MILAQKNFKLPTDFFFDENKFVDIFEFLMDFTNKFIIDEKNLSVNLSLMCITFINGIICRQISR